MKERKPIITGDGLIDCLTRARSIVYNSLRSRFRDPQLADEVCQECIGTAYLFHHNDPSYFDGQDVIEWVLRRANWRALDCLRRRGRAVELPEEYAGEVPVHQGRDQRDAEGREVCRQMTWECLQRLPEEERAALVGHYYDGMTDQEMGTLLFGEGLTPQARGLRVWRLRRRACDHLRALLMAEGFDPNDAGLTGTLAV
jgi:RNA polymerase sigma factor (sigma-70 family)